MGRRFFVIVFFYDISFLCCILSNTSGWNVKLAVLGGEKEAKVLAEEHRFNVRI